MFRQAATIAALAAAPLAARAQPSWSLDLRAANDLLYLYSEAQPTTLLTGCATLNTVPAVSLVKLYQPGLMLDGETFDYAALSPATSASVGAGTVTCSTHSSVGISGLGTSQLVIVCRASTNHTATGMTCPFIGAGHADAAALVPLFISGAPVGAAYRIDYQVEYSASAATSWENNQAFGEDGSYAYGGFELSCPGELPASALNEFFWTFGAPNNSGGTRTRAGSIIASPDVPQPGQTSAPPTLYADAGAFVDDIMRNAGSGTSDAITADFQARIRLSIGPAVPTGACCLDVGQSAACRVGTARACSTAWFGEYRGDGTACRAPINRVPICCAADLNALAGVTVQDLFDFLDSYFAARPWGDFNASGVVSVQDVFDYLAAYFAGC